MKWKLILEYLRVLIYPSIITWILLYFRKNIAAFIDRVWKLKFPGGELEAEKQLEIQTESNKNESVPDEDLEDLFDDGDLVQEMKENYEKTLEETRKSNDEETSKLLNEIAIRDLALEFERIYRAIFGSQISLLRHLNIKGLLGESRIFLDNFFKTAKNSWPILQSLTLDSYLNFLISKNLIDTSQGGYRITDKGSAFLSYITNSGYDDQKTL